MNPKVELIGAYVKVVQSKNDSLIGVHGKVIDETKNTITLQNSKKIKIIKSHVKLELK